MNSISIDSSIMFLNSISLYVSTGKSFTDFYQCINQNLYYILCFFVIEYSDFNTLISEKEFAS